MAGMVRPASAIYWYTDTHCCKNVAICHANLNNMYFNSNGNCPIVVILVELLLSKFAIEMCFNF